MWVGPATRRIMNANRVAAHGRLLFNMSFRVDRGQLLLAVKRDAAGQRENEND